MQTALGVTGPEGIFRSSCETTLRVLREHKPTLLSLLEAFVYDPLVEWSTHGGRGVDTARRDMELAVSLRLFVSRVHELRTPFEVRRKFRCTGRLKLKRININCLQVVLTNLIGPIECHQMDAGVLIEL